MNTSESNYMTSETNSITKPDINGWYSVKERQPTPADCNKHSELWLWMPEHKDAGPQVSLLDRIQYATHWQPLKDDESFQVPKPPLGITVNSTSTTEEPKVKVAILSGDSQTMTHQTQPTGWSCVQTCLAMVMGVDAQEVIRRTNPKEEPRGLSLMDTITAMQRFGMIFAPLVGSSLWDGWHIVTVPSLNHIGGNHAVLVHHDDQGDFRVVDPAIGKRYEENGTNLLSWGEVILVKPSGSLAYWDRA